MGEARSLASRAPKMPKGDTVKAVAFVHLATTNVIVGIHVQMRVPAISLICVVAIV